MTDQRLVYFVRREDGHFYCAQKKWSYNACWTPKMSHAKLLTRIGPAKSACTFMQNHYPDQQPVHIIEFDLHPSKGKVIDVTAHTQASITKKRLRLERQASEHRTREIERLERTKESVTDQLARLVAS